MPVNVGYFTVRQPRVSSINAATTATPSSLGSFSFIDGFNISYTGTASKCFLYITGTRILTLCDDDQNNVDNLNLSTEGLSIQEVINLVTSKQVYSCAILSPNPQQKAYLEGVIKYDLKINPFKVRYNSEKEYFIEVYKRGNLGNAKVNIKEDNFSFNILLNKWSIEDGLIHDVINSTVPSGGIVNLSNSGAQIKFEKALNTSSLDLENLVYYKDLELIKSTDQFLSGVNFQAASILENSFNIMGNPNIIPPQESRAIAWSNDSSLLALGHKGSPYVTVYKRVLSNFTKLTGSSTPSGIGEATGLSWSPNGSYLAVCYDLNPFLDIYKLVDGELIKITNIPTLDLPNGKCTSVSWSADSNILSVAHQLTPFLTNYLRTGDSFTKSNLSNYTPTSPFQDISWSNNGEFLICSQVLYPHIVLYKRVGNNLFYITFNGDLPKGPTYSLSWDKKDQYLVAAHENYPYLTIYKRSNDFFTKLQDPFILPNSECYSVSWSPNSDYFAIGLTKNPYIICYKRIGDTFERLDDFENLPNSSVYSLSWSPNGEYLSSSQILSPYIINYNFIKDFELKINQEIALEGLEYKLDLGTKPQINASKSSPYIFNSTNNILKVRWGSNPVQTFNIPQGTLSAKDVVSSINSKSKNFIAQSFIDDSGKEFVYLIGKKGTSNHQLRIEDGSANSVFGFENFQSKTGSGFGEIVFLERVDGENLTSSVETDNFVLNDYVVLEGNPFLGIDVESISISENDIYKTINKDFVADSSGNINLITIIEDEDLIGNIFKIDNDLYPPSYVLYRNGEALVENVDYVLNPQGGWFNLEQGAFPGDVFSVDYINGVLGKIQNEIIIGGPAVLIGTVDGPFELSPTTNEFKVVINNGDEQLFVLQALSSISANDVALFINQTAIGFKCYICNNKLELRSDNFGGRVVIRIGNGSANQYLGFENNQSVTGVGADGGETALEVKNPPMDIISFTAPQFGNTIIIKNNDVSENYNEGCLIKLDNNYYQIENVFTENKANIVSSVPGPFTIISKTNDTFVFKIDDEDEVTVVFEENTNVSVFDIVSKINETRPLTARVFTINGSNKIQIIGENSVYIGLGSANRTLGFEEDVNDTNTLDTYIKISGEFKTTYLAPSVATTINPIIFEKGDFLNFETPQGSSIFKIEGNHVAKMTANKFVVFDGLHYYKIISSNLNEDGDTEISLHEKIDIPIFEDTSVSYSIFPVYEEGDTILKTKNFVYLENPHILKKNGNILELDTDYSISENGEVELSSGLLYGDSITLTYSAKRFLSPNTEVRANYSYFSFLPLKTNLKYSFQALNSDCFYVNTLHGSTILQRTVDEVSSNVQSNLSSGSSGFPTGEVPSSENDKSGVTTFNYTIGDLDDKIILCQKVFEFYDSRVLFFENERRYLNGWVVGAESGRVTLQQIIDGATLPSPQRLFPNPDNRPFDQRSKPLRVPALDGKNENDAQSSANGVTSSYLLTKLSSEKTQLNLEKTRLQNLLTLSTNTSTLVSTGNISGIRGQTIILYVEARDGDSLVQRTVSVVLPDQVEIGGILGGPSTIVNPSPSSVADAINNAVDNAFSGITVRPATANSSQVILTASSSAVTKCCLVIQDTPNLGFGVGNQAAIRSRHTSYTAGAIYSGTTVPGSNSVNLDNVLENNLRDECNNLHDNQIIALEGQKQEWLSSFEQSFIEAKSEILKVEDSLNESNLAIASTNQFLNLKFNSGVFNSIDSDATINNRISEINNRILEIDRRTSEINSRIIQLTQSLSREGLYNARYSWIIYLADKSIGYYATKSREIDLKNKRSLDAADGLELLKSINNLF